MDLNDCKSKGFVKKVKPNKELAKSLIEMSDIKEKTLKSAKIDENTISAYLPMAYDSLREIMEAICITFGHKVTNHICIGELLKTLVADFDFSEFDRFRYARNSINYYGEKVEYKQGKEIIDKIILMKNNLKKRIIL